MQTQQTKVKEFKKLVRKEILSLRKDLDKAKTGSLKRSNLYVSDYSDLINMYNKVLKCDKPHKFDELMWDLDTFVRDTIPARLWKTAQSFEVYKKD